jgi:hypothetical protein
VTWNTKTYYGMLSWHLLLTYLRMSSVWGDGNWTFITVIPAPLSGHTNLLFNFFLITKLGKFFCVPCVCFKSGRIPRLQLITKIVLTINTRQTAIK